MNQRLDLGIRRLTFLVGLEDHPDKVSQSSTAAWAQDQTGLQARCALGAPLPCLQWGVGR